MPKKSKQLNKIYLILHNIRSTHNVGSIFRTADAAGVSKIYLTGYTPPPFDKLGKLEQNFAKTALGAEKSVEWHPKKFAEANHGARNINNLISKLKKEGVQIVAVEQDKRSTLHSKFKPHFPIALILGNEVIGIDKKILNKVDKIIEIPMKGQKESLNVSVAAGVALFRIIC